MLARVSKGGRGSVHPYRFLPVFHGTFPVLIATVCCVIHPQVGFPIGTCVLLPL